MPKKKTPCANGCGNLAYGRICAECSGRAGSVGRRWKRADAMERRHGNPKPVPSQPFPLVLSSIYCPMEAPCPR